MPRPTPTPDRAANQGSQCSFPVIGIGASAGGLEALTAFFEALPRELPAAFVVIQHLSPDFRSLMDDLLAQHTDLPIRVVEDGEPLARGVVYLIPPGKEMITASDRLLLSERARQDLPHLPIDQFFRSMADDFNDHATGIVLSGTGSDGTRGLQAIREAGGAVLVQKPDSARFDGMPKSALEAIQPDLIGTPAELARFVAELVADEEQAKGLDPDGAGLADLLDKIRRERGVDFSLYKPGLVERRIQRRMAATSSPRFDRYCDKVSNDPVEALALYRDLLVSVTSFFRDAEAFEILRIRAIPRIVDAGLEDHSLRVWCVGCATGEEAYSLAMLIEEELDRRGARLDYKLFASDIDDTALEVAAAGRYPHHALAELGADRIARFFDEDAQGHVIRRELRDRIVFARHDLTRDPPFTRLHLISCRNLLIYLKKQNQARSMNVLHFALATGGFLFLGPSEVPPAGLDSEFHSIDRKWNVFRKVRDIRMPALELPTGRAPLPNRPHVGGAGVTRRPHAIEELQLVESLCAVLLRIPASAALVVDQNRHVERVLGDPSPWLRLPEGRTDNDLLRMVGPHAKASLSLGLRRAFASDQEVHLDLVEFGRELGEQVSTVHIVHLSTTNHGSRHVAVLLHASGAAHRDLPDAEALSGDSRLRALDDELRSTKLHLQSTVEELEAANEELQSTNEELLASNEELQSTNEELHSVNEELFTVNAEHQAKIEELTELSHDVENLMRATQIGTIFLDTDLRIRKFTPAIRRGVALTDQDIGRPLSDLAHRLGPVDLPAICRGILDTGQTFERETTAVDGGSFLLRVLPYRESRDAIAGVVLTLIDVGEIKSAQQRLARSEARFRELVENIDDTFWIRSSDCREILYLSPQFERVYGRPAEELIREPNRLFDYVHPSDRGAFREYLLGELPRGRNRGLFYRLFLPDGSLRWIHSRGHPVFDENGEVARIVGFARDVTEQKAQEQALIELTRELESQANRDPLTRLWNRRGLDGLLSREIERGLRTGASLVAVMIDLDDFKRVNDTLGHSAGDVVLQGIAQRMSACTRPNDVLARIGGDEFLALLPDTRLAEATQVAERLRLAISDSPIQLSGESIRVTASLGVARVPETAVAVEEVMGQTRHALSSGKSSGKNRVVVSEEGAPMARADCSSDEDHDSAEFVLETVLAGHGIRAYAQTIRSVADGSIAGYELLARGPEGTYQGPEDLFRLSIERNVLSLVDLQCFKTCVAAARALATDRIHVNLFPSTLIDTPLERLLATLESGGGARRFCIELSEQQFLGDPAYLVEPIRALRDAGVRVAIDDVGFGRSSLESLIVLEPDLLKVDRSYVAGASGDGPKERNLSRLIRVADHLASEIVAEGVEAERDLALLAALKVPFAQGYFWDRPSEVASQVRTSDAPDAPA